MIEEYRETLRSYTKRTDSKVTLYKNQGGGMIVRHPDSVKKKESLAFMRLLQKKAQTGLCLA